MHERILGGRYWLLEPHAMGGMASVWRAVDGRTSDTVAIKRLHPHLVADEGARARLEREAATLAGIRHPNVVAVRELLLDTDDPALVLDFVEGRSLADRLASDRGPLPLGEALAIAVAVADGLASVHAAGIVHRDVKPANILLGRDGVVRLTDFGIAVGLEDATALTAADGVVGTLRYLAPERLTGAPATPATDVWGVGAILYELLAGQPAFPAGTVAERVAASVDDLSRPAASDAATWTVLARALAAAPDDRYPDGAALAQGIRALPAFRTTLPVPVAADDPTTVVPIRPAVATNPGSAPIAALAAGAVASAAAAGRAAPPLEPRVGRRPWAMGALLAALITVAAIGMAAGGVPGEAPAAAPSAAASAGPAAADATPVADEPAPAGEDHGKAGERGNGKAKGHDKDDKDDDEGDD